MKLVIVESPAKVRTISKYLGEGYRVAASMGHLVDLPKKDLGVDTEKDFEPKYVVSNRKALKSLKDEFKKADVLVIASDPDREGEAIGWHVAQRLEVITPSGKLKDAKKKLERIVFTSITREAVEEAIKNPRIIDFNLVDAQQARRILDRLVGYKLSPLLWKKIQYGLSAGRVQSVTVRLIVDREEEREKFKEEEYWTVLADLLTEKSGESLKKIIRKRDEEKELKLEGIKFELAKVDDKKPKLEREKDAQKVLDDVGGKKWIISSVDKKETKRYPKPPFITSTLQRTAANIFGYGAKKTMSVAQKLYEAGHITYMRTDSLTIVPSALSKIRTFVKSKYGDEYLNPKTIVYKTKSKAAQEAHEAIRPSDVSKDSSSLGLSGDEKKLYDLIRNRAIATQMNPARVENTVLEIKIDKYLFQSKGQRILFDGYLRIYKEQVSENILPEIKLNQELYPKRLIGQQHFTQPPPRYSEASLIKTLEKYGIGRPSTYAPIISTILARKYVIKEGKYFVPTEMGKVVTRLLKKYFEKIVDTGFTSEMEEDLDKIADGKADKTKVLREFYTPFSKDVESGEKKIERDEFTVLGPSKFKCPECGKKMVKKIGKFGVFLSCADFPKCKGMRSLDGKSEEDREKETQKEANSHEFTSKYLPAPKAIDGTLMILKTGRYGKFWAHGDYPKVKEAVPLLLKEKCPLCSEPLVERKGKWGKFFIGCSGYPKCRYIKKTQNSKVSPRGGPAFGGKSQK